jgi:DNA-binding response OmpR family regulator
MDHASAQSIWGLLLTRAEIHPYVSAVLPRRLLRLQEDDNPQAILAIAWQRNPDLLLIESTPAHSDTVDYCRSLRLYFRFPILIIEDGASEAERIAMLDSGADDVVAVRQGLADLLARVNALIRRSERERRRNPYAGYLQVYDFYLDVRGRRLLLPENQIDLSLTQTRLLALLFNEQGGFVSDMRLAEHLFGQISPETINRVTAALDTLRRRINVELRLSPIIERIHGQGYRLAQ